MWLNFRDTDLDQAALKAWPMIAAEAGLPRRGWKMTRLYRRDEADTSCIVLLLQHPSGKNLAYKYQMRPEGQGGFVAQFERQQKFFNVFGHHDNLAMPEPIYVSKKRQASLMEYVPGRTIGKLVRLAEGNTIRQLELLSHAGAWLDAFHRTLSQEQRVFQPKRTLEYYHDLRTRILAGETRVAAKQMFLNGIARLSELAPHFEGRETIAAAHHGDFHMGNLVFDGTKTYGLDISSDRVEPVGYDIAKVLLDFAAIAQNLRTVPPGKIVSSDVMRAFFDGYTLVGPDDPSVNFLIYPRLLATLTRVPQKKSARSIAQQRTLRTLRPFAKNAFEHRPD